MSFADEAKAVAEPVNKLLVPVSSSAGSTLQDVWDLVFGGFGTYVEKKRLTRLKALEDFKRSLEDKVAAIPEERLCEPPLSTVGPAMEASKYYFEEPEIREMFARLIASSMDREKANGVHPAFPEIVKQMSPLDARNLACLAKDNFPIVEYRQIDKSNHFVTLFSHIFLGNPAEKDLFAQSRSISSLSRLGLVNTSYERFLVAERIYDPFRETTLYQALAEQYPADGPHRLDIQKGQVALTPLGEKFREICLS